MTAAGVEEYKKINNLLAVSYSLGPSSNKLVTVGYNAATLKPVLTFTSDKRRFVLTPLEFKTLDKEGSLWRLALNQRKTVSIENVTMKITSLREIPKVIFLNKTTEEKFILEEMEVRQLFKLRKLLSTYLFTLTVNRCTVVEFFKEYKTKLEQRGCFLDFDDFETVFGLIHRLDYYRLFLEIPVLCPNIHQTMQSIVF